MPSLSRLVIPAALSLTLPACAARRQPAPPTPAVVDAAPPPSPADAAVDAAPPDAALPLTVPADAVARTPTPEDLKRWRIVLGGALSAAGASGWASVVVIGERVVDRHGTGLTARPGPTALTPDVPRPMGPLTRVVTALLVAALIEEGHLDWAAPVTRLRRDWAATANRPTVSELACGCYGIAAVPGTPPRSAAQVLDRLKAHLVAGDTLEAMPTPVLVAAGGYLAALGAPSTPIEPGAAYADQIAERVAGPLGMALTIGDPAAPGVIPVFAPHDGGWASVDDLGRLAIALVAGGLTPSGGRVVEAAAIARLLEVFDGQAGPATRAGLGVDARGAVSVLTGGGEAGHGTTRMFLVGQMGWAIRVEGGGPAVDAALEAGLEDLLALRYDLGPGAAAAAPEAAPADAGTDAAPMRDAGPDAAKAP